MELSLEIVRMINRLFDLRDELVARVNIDTKDTDLRVLQHEVNEIERNLTKHRVYFMPIDLRQFRADCENGGANTLSDAQNGPGQRSEA